MDNRRRMLLSGGLSADPVLENNDWATISKVARAGKAAQFWKVGDLKNISIGGVTYAAQIIGFDHDDVTYPATYGREKAGITFQLQKLTTTTYAMNSSMINDGGWKNCLMRTSTMPTIKNSLSSELQNVITTVKKSSGLGGGSTSGVEITNDDCFLLSEVELFGGTSYSVSGEGFQYAYYAVGNSKIKERDGVESRFWEWWERSPRYNNSTEFCAVHASGGAARALAHAKMGIAFAFCV